jgi:NhaA family Na+:H+ antiporter
MSRPIRRRAGAKLVPPTLGTSKNRPGSSLLRTSPQTPIDRLIEPIERFMHVEAAGGIVLLVCTVVALAIANSPFADAYHHFWETEIGITVGGLRLSHSLEHWINDGLMALFFFVVGLEVKRELVLGELRDPRRAALPLVAAIGGMVVPAAVYLALQAGTPAQRGWGIPMATDIAFVVGCMAVLGSRVTQGIRAMILTLAIADDIGAILVIALGYSAGIHVPSLALGMAGAASIVVLARLGVRSFGVYTLVGALVWLAFLQSGIHATLAGVVIGLLTPAEAHSSETGFAQLLKRIAERASGGAFDVGSVREIERATRETVSPLAYLEARLHPWVAFVVMPVFALANAGVPIRLDSLGSPVALAVAAGLVVGKPFGIVATSWLAVRLGIARLPEGASWTAIAAGGVLAGIGFTMALFVASLALEGALLESAKVGVLVGSAVSAVAGLALFVARVPARA